MKKVLIIAAHPDDEVLGCGGMIAKYGQQGVQFKVVFIAEGSSCRYDDPGSAESTAAVEFRTRQAVNALAVLGVTEYAFYDLPCGRLDQTPIIKINKIIEQEIRIFKPDTVFTHSATDANNDHKIVFNATIMATRPGALNQVARLYSFEVLSSSEWSFNGNFTANYFECLSQSELNLKWQALTCYESEIRQFPFPRSEEGIRTQAMQRGMQAGFSLAEAFHLIRELKE